MLFLEKRASRYGLPSFTSFATKTRLSPYKPILTQVFMGCGSCRLIIVSCFWLKLIISVILLIILITAAIIIPRITILWSYL